MIGRHNNFVTEAQQRFTFTRRAFLLRGAQTGIGVALVARMGWLSIVENEHFKSMADSNSVSLSLIPPRRGWIVDRNGKPLALNKTSFRVDVIPDRMTDKAKTIADLVSILGLSPADQQTITESLEDAAGYQPVQIADNLSLEAYAALSIRAPELPGVAPAQSYSRFYPDGAGVAHLLGYLGTASNKQYQESHDPLLITPGFKIGKDGIEKVMEAKLRGTPGARRSEVTARGKWVRDLANRPDTPGATQRLTINADLQNYASRRLGDNSGAVVVLDCWTGDVLAMTSMPAYDPNNFSSGISKSDWAMLAENDHLPLSNKVLQGLYPAGSTFKPTMALALLDAGVPPDEKVNCTGSYRIGDTIFHCDKRTGHGPIAMHQAIAQSCDIYFYHYGRMVGIDKIAPMARTMALGQKFELPMPSQRYGTVPDPAWLERRVHRKWSTYDTINLSIGQGYLLVNPLQLAVMAGRIASGRAIEPHLLYDHSHGIAPSLNVNQEHLALIRSAMYGVVNEGGTAAGSALHVPGVHMAGKTGTAQVRHISMAERAKGVRSNASLAWRARDHSLFIGFAPTDQPRYAASCIVEHGGFGASVAAPIIRDTLSYLFDPVGATANLVELEKGWGGDIATRMKIQKMHWDANHNIKTPLPKVDTDAQANVANANGDEGVPDDDAGDSKAKGDRPAPPSDAPLAEGAPAKAERIQSPVITPVATVAGATAP